MDQIKIATLNLCLGLKNKKDLVKDILCENSVDILLMQETEIDNGFDCRLLSIPGYVLEIEDYNLSKHTANRKDLSPSRMRQFAVLLVLSSIFNT